MQCKHFYTASIKQDASLEESGHNGESATTFPMIISVGETNSSSATLSARSFNSAKTCVMIVNSHCQFIATSSLQTGKLLVHKLFSYLKMSPLNFKDQK